LCKTQPVEIFIAALQKQNFQRGGAEKNGRIAKIAGIAKS
jgi:hypothetical protein